VNHPMLRLEEVSDELYQVSNLDLPDFSRTRLWIFDLEATGLDTTKERVTQVAGVPFVGGRTLDDEAFSQLVYPGDGVEISEEVQELTGITPKRLEGQPTFPKVWADCVRAARGCDIWVGQSVFEFDVPLLQTEFERHGMPSGLPAIMDSVVLATHMLGPPERRWSTSALLQKFSVDVSGLRRHDALDDVLILGRILTPLLGVLRDDHADRLLLPEEPLPIRRHAPVRS